MKKVLSLLLAIMLPLTLVSAATWQNASEWAVTELNKAEEMALIPEILKSKDLTELITREEFAEVAVLVYEKLSGLPAQEPAANPFTDTDNKQILKAYNIGITKGTSESLFSPQESLTREQAAVMLARAYTKGFRLLSLPEYEKPQKFADHTSISGFATDSVYFMTSKGYIKGTDAGFEPQGTCSREAALLIAVRLAEGEGTYKIPLDAPKVTRFFENKKGAVSITFDDGDYDSGVFFNKELKRLGLKGTAMLIAGRIKNPSLWGEILKDGYIDVGNHSMAHNIKYDEGHPDSAVQYDITEGYNTLKEYYPDQNILTFATPWGKTSHVAQKEIAQNHYASRSAGGNVPNQPDSIDFMNLKSYTFHETSAKTMTTWTDAAINQRGWVIPLLHGCVDGEVSDEYNIAKPIFTEYAEHLATKKDELWIASFNEVIAYLKEAKSVAFEVKQEDNRLTISVTDNLPDDKFFQPLTIKVNIDPNWKSIKASQSGKDLTVKSYTELNKAYIEINVVPDKGEVIIENQ